MISEANMSISVIVPTYNNSQSLARCLDSVFNQSQPPTQVIIINDGSTDDTAKFVNDYGHTVTYLEQTNLGPSAARNAGLNVATGDYIAFLDADDYWHKDFLKECACFIENHPEVIAVSTGQRFVTIGGEDVIRPQVISQENDPSSPTVLHDFFSFWTENDHVRTGTCLINRSVIENAGPMLEDLRMGEDLEYWGYLATFGKWGFIPSALWVCDPWEQAASQGWRRRNTLRRQSCPTVERWQRRIVCRINDEEMKGFSLVRGRVAYSYAFAKILSGDFPGARETICNFGSDFPNNRYSKIFLFFSGPGYRVMFVLRRLLLFKEFLKEIRLSLGRSVDARN